MTGAPRTPRIVPFRGTYYALSDRARSLVNGLVYPVPDPTFPFLGVHFTKQISGEMWAGPNAVLAFAREGYTLRDLRRRDLWETLSYRGFRRMARRYWRTGLTEAWGEVSKRAFVAAMRKQVPAVGIADLGARHAGVRAQAVAEDGTLLDDFWLDEAPNVTHIRNAPFARRDLEPGAGEANRGRDRPVHVADAGGGTRTLTPLKGTPGFKPGAYRQFRHPGSV